MFSGVPPGFRAVSTLSMSHTHPDHVGTCRHAVYGSKQVTGVLQYNMLLLLA